MDSDIENRIRFASEVVEQQISLFERHHGSVDSEWKHDGSRVTEADHALSAAFRESLLNRFSTDQFFSEEGDHQADPIALTSRFSWLIDPIDGTNNFARGLPSCSISLALLEEGLPIYGYIYDHSLKTVIHGGKGHGVFLGQDPVSLSTENPSSQSLVATQLTSKTSAIEGNAVLQKRYKARCYGSSAIHLGYVAAGLIDAVVAYKVNSWDIAAGMAMLDELGGRNIFFDTNPFPMSEFNIAAKPFGHLSGSPLMVEEIQNLLNVGG